MRGPNPFQQYQKLGNVTAGWGAKTLEEKFHPAVDIANNKGTPIPAIRGGVVSNVMTARKQGANNFGNTVEIKDTNGDVHQYHHLDQVNVKPGQVVTKGHVIGTMGNSGATYSPSGQGDGTHLDYRIVSAFGKYKNPMTYVQGLVQHVDIIDL